MQIILSLCSKIVRNNLCGGVCMCDSVWLCLSVCACPSCLWSTTDCTSCYFTRACHSHFVMVTDSPSAYICVHVLSKLAFCDWLHLCMHIIPFLLYVVVCGNLTVVSTLCNVGGIVILWRTLLMKQWPVEATCTFISDTGRRRQQHGSA